jgi:hypothetical protein
MLRVYLDSIYNSLQGKGLTNDQIMDILRSEASKLQPPPTDDALDDYFWSRNLKQ